MKNPAILLLPIAGLAACSAPNENEPPIVTPDSVSAVRAEPIDDKLLECTDRPTETSYTTSTVVAVGGAFKSYFETDNLAADFCRWGELECVFGWQDGKAVFTKFIPERGRTTVVYDFDAATMEKYQDRIEGDDEYTRIECEAKPLPEGMSILL